MLNSSVLNHIWIWNISAEPVDVVDIVELCGAESIHALINWSIWSCVAVVLMSPSQALITFIVKSKSCFLMKQRGSTWKLWHKNIVTIQVQVQVQVKSQKDLEWLYSAVPVSKFYHLFWIVTKSCPTLV